MQTPSIQAALTWWFTGLPGAGKTTLATAWAEQLRAQQRPVVLLDGDELRRGLSSDLGFSDADRFENMRRVGEVARLLNDAGVDALVALVSPTLQGRATARTIIGPHRFIEVHVATPLAVCQQRDPKGLYARALAGQISGLTGWDAPYEVPGRPDFTFDTAIMSVPDMVQALFCH